MNRVVLTELGIVVYDGDKISNRLPFGSPASEYAAIQDGSSGVPALKSCLRGTDATVNDRALLRILRKASMDVRECSEAEAADIRSSKLQILEEAGFASGEDDAMDKLRRFALELSSFRIAAESQSPDLHIIQAVGALDSLDDAINAAASHMREWYGLHFPELESLADGIPGYAGIASAGRRDGLSRGTFEAAGYDARRSEMMDLVCGKSRGGEISDANLRMVQALAAEVLALHRLRSEMESHIDEQMRSSAPNVTAILGATVGAKLLSRAGSLRRLASMSSSTIQILGAEKALFRSLKTGSQPPKHGLLFQHPLVHSAPRWQRGKVARAVAAKAAIAARIDYHTGEPNGALLQSLEARISEISEKYKDPPERPPAKPPGARRKRGGFRRKRA
ncbi:ribosomal biogenesis protein/nucleolar protein [Cenarchaeum symbiosum A]|uniref:Ribosomal biogenesis protein/nucleolar protein n=1 Tax=Cenarchaeum symbiosum (strain A) TaxID=414004 RepID=A0RV23_CENSY|nr:ribosomal biogenesis protein/nucleolar protein [Cenarchaeum symbiosum A]